MKKGTPRAHNWLATLRNWGVPLLLLGVFAALMFNLTSVDAQHVLDTTPNTCGILYPTRYLKKKKVSYCN